MKILIVDDELVSRMKLKKIMENLGDCQTAESGEEALDIVMGGNPPDLILLDIIMPGMDGYQVCQRLKFDSGTKDIPVIFLSANADIEDITRGLELGAVDYITKPFNREEVKARARTHLTLKKMREELHAKNFVLEAQMSDLMEKTEQLRQKDLQLIEMDRIAGIGTLASGIAHEINNPLGFVKSSVFSLRKGFHKMATALKYRGDEPPPETLDNGCEDYYDREKLDNIVHSMETRFERIERGIERITKIVNSLKRFSRLDMEPVGKIDINKSMEDAIEILTNERGQGVKFVKEFQEVPPMECSPAEINQAILHILKNALDAVDSKGTVKMNTNFQQTDNRIVIRIADDGKGMSPDVARQALNPFFSTKPVGTGTGVGLSLTERIIKRHNGRLDISSSEGEGTTVTLTLPAG